MSDEKRTWYKRTHQFTPYTKADGTAVSDEFDAIQASFERIPEMRDDGKGFAVSPIIPTPTDANHPVTFGMLTETEKSVNIAHDDVTEKAKQVAQNTLTVATNTQTAINHASAASQSASSALSSQQSANDSENMARKWASNPVDEVVLDQKYSAYHYAMKASESAHNLSLAEQSAQNNANIAIQKAEEAKKSAETARSHSIGEIDYSKVLHVPSASTTTAGIVELSSDDDSDNEDKAATPKAIKKLKALFVGLRRLLDSYIPNSKKSSAVNSNSEEYVATSKAVKTTYDLAAAKQSPATTLSGYGISNFKVEGFVGDVNTLKTDGLYAVAQASRSQNLPVPGNGCHIQVIGGADSTWCRQIAYITYSGDMYERHQMSYLRDEWSPWKKLNTDGIPVGAIVSFPREVTNPSGFLRANGTTFNAQTFPDLHRTLGGNKLPNLTRSDVGMTAYFAVDSIPDGWIAFDEIATRVTQQAYPELYRYLVGKYGSIANVPKAEDRFIRNAGNGLGVGQVQSDEIKAHNHATNWQVSNESGVADNEIASGSRNRENAWFRLRTENTGGTETRPKSLVLKLCIKAINTFDDVVFWIKSHGEVTNAGVLDAGRLAQGLQDKADRNHTHTTSQIADFNQGVTKIIEQGFTYQKIGNFEIRKYPDGTMIQTSFIEFNDISNLQVMEFNGVREQQLIWPLSFLGEPINFGFLKGSYQGGLSGQILISIKSTNSTLYWRYVKNHTVPIGLCRIQFLAIGRWK